jgi:cyclophilin family peptidyl-prolyl cis-trans isomerase
MRFDRLFLFPLIILALVSFSVTPEEPAPPKLRLSATAEKDKYSLGDMINIRVTLENIGDKEVEIIKPVLDNFSVSFDIIIKPKPKSSNDENIKNIEFKHTAFTPSVFDNRREGMGRIKLEPNTGTTRTFGIPAIKNGEYKIIASYQNQGNEIKANEIKVAADNKDADDLVAIIYTSLGNITAQFYPEEAPDTIINFINLARKGFYEGLIFHRIVKDFVIQGGCPNGDGSGGPGYNIPAEFNQKPHLTGVLSMARMGNNVNSAGSQFFICLADQSRLDGKYTAFGEVIQGKDVVDAIGKVEVAHQTEKGIVIDKPVKDVTIKKVFIETRAKK